MTDRAKPMNNAGKPAKNIPLTRVDDNLKNFQPHDNRGDSGGVESDRAKEVEAIVVRLKSELNDCHTRYYKREIPDVITFTDLQNGLLKEAIAAIAYLIRRAEVEAELHGRLHQVIELFQQGTLSANSYSLLHASLTDRINELREEQ